MPPTSCWHAAFLGSGSFNKQARDGCSAMTLALADTAALQSYWEAVKLNTVGQKLGVKRGGGVGGKEK